MTGKLLGVSILCFSTWFNLPSLAVEIPAELKLRKMGITVREMTSQQNEYGESPVEVVEVIGSAGRGFKPNDLIISVDSIEVRGVEDLAEIVATLPRCKALPVRISRNGGTYFLAVKL